MKNYLNYKITNLIDGKVYIGYHTGNESDGYLCSSQNKHFWNAIRKYEPGCKGLSIDDIKLFYSTNRFINFKKETIQYYSDEKSMKEGEKYWIEFYRNLLGWENVYNLHDGGHGGWSYINRSEDIRQKRLDNIASEYNGDSAGHLHTKEMEDKAHNRCKELYGDNMSQLNNQESLAKRLKTNSEKYGGDSAGQLHTKEVREKINATNLQMYGSPYGKLHDPETRAKVEESKRRRGTLRICIDSMNTPEAREKSTRPMIYECNGRYLVRSNNWNSWRKSGAVKLCELSQWEEYCLTNNIDKSLLNK